MCRVENTYLMLKRDLGHKRFTFTFYKLKINKKSYTGIPELVKATGNVVVADASSVNDEMLRVLVRKKEERALPPPRG